MTGVADAVLGQLEEPGRILVFCDDTDLAGTPAPGVAADLRMLCAVVLPSECYSSAVFRMSERLKVLGQTEFHAKEIVNPNSSSTWKQVDIQDRICAFELMRDLVTTPSAETLLRLRLEGPIQAAEGFCATMRRSRRRA